MSAPKDDAEIIAEFKKILETATPADLHRLLGSGVLGNMISGEGDTAEPVELRRPPRDEAVTYQVRVDLDRAKPPIWRRLELRSDLTLDRVHDALQTAFGWWDIHLHLFTLGGRAFDSEVQNFLCPFDADEGEIPGIPGESVRLDEVMQEAGDRLFYVYDYGDDWGLTLKLEKVSPRRQEEPDAICTGGRRAGPPEDCGGVRDGEGLAQILEDPTEFDMGEINEVLTFPER